MADGTTWPHRLTLAFVGAAVMNVAFSFWLLTLTDERPFQTQSAVVSALWASLVPVGLVTLCALAVLRRSMSSGGALVIAWFVPVGTFLTVALDLNIGFGAAVLVVVIGALLWLQRRPGATALPQPARRPLRAFLLAFAAIYAFLVMAVISTTELESLASEYLQVSTAGLGFFGAVLIVPVWLLMLAVGVGYRWRADLVALLIAASTIAMAVTSPDVVLAFVGAGIALAAALGWRTAASGTRLDE